MYPRIKNNRIFIHLSTLGPIGYLKAPGTMATLATLPLIVFLKSFLAGQNYFLFMAFSVLISLLCIHQSIPFFAHADPSEIVLDEYIGCLFTFWALPIHRSSLLLGFLLFRFFDIFKCFGIKSCERLGGAWGIILDDVVAGLFANLCLQLIFMILV